MTFTLMPSQTTFVWRNMPKGTLPDIAKANQPYPGTQTLFATTEGQIFTGFWNHEEQCAYTFGKMISEKIELADLVAWSPFFGFEEQYGAEFVAQRN